MRYYCLIGLLCAFYDDSVSFGKRHFAFIGLCLRITLCCPNTKTCRVLSAPSFCRPMERGCNDGRAYNIGEGSGEKSTQFVRTEVYTVCADVRMCGCADVRTCGCADVRTQLCGHVCADVRTCGHVYADVRMCGRADTVL